MKPRLFLLLPLLVPGLASADDDVVPPAPAECLAPPVSVRRFARPDEAEMLSLSRCDGSPNLDALDALSMIARPHSVAERPALSEDDPGHVAPGVRRLHPGLLTRLQSIATRFPDRAIIVVSGYRPTSRGTSRHHHAEALDIEVDGAQRFEVAEHARTLAETGVGYYPNSSFTHIDVRERSAYWIDLSGPGEPPDYIRPSDEDDAREVIASAMDALRALETASFWPPPDAPAPAPAAEPASMPEPAPAAGAEPTSPAEPVATREPTSPAETVATAAPTAAPEPVADPAPPALTPWDRPEPSGHQPPPLPDWSAEAATAASAPPPPPVAPELRHLLDRAYELALLAD